MRKMILVFYVLFLLVNINVYAQQIKLKIIETTDSHGAIYPYDFVNDRENNNSLAQVYSYIKEERADTSQSVILLSGGDILQGTPAVYYYNFEDTLSPHLYADVMNFMRYDAGTVGNHDIETGHNVYDKFNSSLTFPWLAANALKTGTNEPYFKPYAVLERAGLKIAVLGLITPHIPHWLPPKLFSGMEFDDMIESARYWMRKIKETEKPDIVIGLFHAGVDFTYGGQTADTYKNENASMLVAEEVPGFDVVFVGHDHHGWNKTITNTAGQNVLLMGGTAYAKELAVAELLIIKTENGLKLTKRGKLVKSSNYKADEEFTEKFQKQFEAVKTYVNRPIGEIKATITTKTALFGDSPFVDLIHKIQLNISGAQISFAAPLSFDAEITKGKIYVRDMFKLYRYENMLYTMSLTGDEIDKVLEYSYSGWFNQMKNEDDHLLNFEKDENGNLILSERTHFPLMKQRFYNFESAEGIVYTVDVSKPAGERVEITKMIDGSKFYPDSLYAVAVNSYRGNGGGGHLTRGAGISPKMLSLRLMNSTDKDLRYYMMKWIEKQKVINPVANNNWKVIPTEWYQKAKEKDYKLLFEKNE